MNQVSVYLQNNSFIIAIFFRFRGKSFTLICRGFFLFNEVNKTVPNVKFYVSNKNN